MKKLLISLMLILSACVFTAKGANQLYIIGEVEGNDFAWNPTKGVEMTNAGSNIFFATVQIGAEGTHHATFGFTSKLGTNDSDWDTCNRDRYGAQNNNDLILDGQKTTLVKTGSNSFRIETGEYNIIVNMTTMTVTCVNTGKGITPTYPELLYIIGDVDGTSWDPANGNVFVEMSSTTGTYICNIDIIDLDDDGYGTFAFGSKLGADSNDWDTFNANRYGPIQKDTELSAGMAGAIGQNGDTSFKVPSGAYAVKVDLTLQQITMFPVIMLNENIGAISLFVRDDDTEGVKGDFYQVNVPLEGVKAVDNMLYAATLQGVTERFVENPNPGESQGEDVASDYDQRDWVVLNLGTAENAAKYAGTTIPAGIVGQYSGSIAPTLDVRIMPEGETNGITYDVDNPNLYELRNIYNYESYEANGKEYTVFRMIPHYGEYAIMRGFVERDKNGLYWFTASLPTVDGKEDVKMYIQKRSGIDIMESPDAKTYMEIPGIIKKSEQGPCLDPTGASQISTGVGAVIAEDARDNVRVVGGTGVIKVIGEVDEVKVFTVSGIVVSENETEVQCEAGVYIVKTGTEVTKVVVR